MLCETIAVDPSSLFYFAHGSHGSHGLLTRDFWNTNRTNYTNILLHTDLTRIFYNEIFEHESHELH